MKRFQLLAAAAFVVTYLAGCSDDFESEVKYSPDSRAEVSVPDTSTNSFYYCKDYKVPLTIDYSRQLVVTDSTTPAPRNYLKRISYESYTGYVVDSDSVNILFATDDIVAVENVLADGTTFTHHFYVVLKQESDLDFLRQKAAELGCKIEYQLPYSPLYVKLSTGGDPEYTSLEAANALWETGRFEITDPGIYMAPPTQEPATNSGNSPYYISWTLPNMWNLSGKYGIDIESAWKYTKGSPDITVAVIDSYFDESYFEIAGRIHPASYSVANAPSIHGLDVAMIAVGNGIETGGYIGVAPNVTLMKIAPFEGAKTWNEKAVSAINYAWQNGADVINCSWHMKDVKKDYYMPMMIKAINDAYAKGRNGKGAAVVFAAGNRGIIEAPANLIDDIMVVGATNINGLIYSDSGRGKELDVTAPGDKIITYNTPENSGTSLAAPHVSGIAALILSIRPDLTAKQVCTVINETAQHTNHSWKDGYGWGIANARRALEVLSEKFDIVNYQIVDNTLTLTDSKNIFYIDDLPKSATVTWRAEKGSITEGPGRNDISLNYDMNSTHMIKETVTATVTYMGKTTTVSKTFDVIPVKPIITDISIADYYGFGSPDEVLIEIKTNTDFMDVSWNILGERNGSFNLDYPYFIGDAAFAGREKFIRSVKLSGGSSYQPSTCLIEAVATRPGGSYTKTALFKCENGNWSITPDATSLSVKKEKNE